MKLHEIFLLSGLIGIAVGAILFFISFHFYDILEKVFIWLGGIVLTGSFVLLFCSVAASHNEISSWAILMRDNVTVNEKSYTRLVISKDKTHVIYLNEEELYKYEIIEGSTVINISEREISHLEDLSEVIINDQTSV